MNFKTAIDQCFRKYAQFTGRASRPELWYFFLFEFLLLIVASMLERDSSVLSSLVGLGLLLPGLAVTCRRLHDMDRSGWWQLITLVPLVGSLVLIVWCCQRGTPGPNRFGPPTGSTSGDSSLAGLPVIDPRLDLASQLAELTRLREQGHLSQAEFDAAKAKALG